MLNMWSRLRDQLIISAIQLRNQLMNKVFHSCFLGFEIQFWDSFHGCVILPGNLVRELVDVKFGNDLDSKFCMPNGIVNI